MTEKKIDRSWLKAFRQSKTYQQAKKNGIVFRSEHEVDKMYQAILSEHDPHQALPVFAYGSLIWNPVFKYSKRYRVRLLDYYRDFCIKTISFRATPDLPGLMLGLRHQVGKYCDAYCLEIAAKDIANELPIVWLREALTTAYMPMWLTVYDEHKLAHKALVFVANAENERFFTQSLPLHEQASMIARAEGELGSSRQYLYDLYEQLQLAEFKETNIENLVAQVKQLS